MSIRRKLFLFTIAIVIGILFVVYIPLIYYEKMYLIEETKKSQVVLLSGLARICRESLLRCDDLFLVNYLKTLKEKSPIIDYAMFIDMNNKIVAHTEMSYIGSRISNKDIYQRAQQQQGLLIQSLEKIVLMSLPVVLGTKREGTALVGFSTKGIQKEITTTLTKVQQRILIICVLGLFFGFIAAYILSLIFVKPIKALIKAIRSS